MIATGGEGEEGETGWKARALTTILKRIDENYKNILLPI